MEENINLEISETNRGRKQIIINRNYKFNFSKNKKDNTKVYRCTEYKKINKCKSFIIYFFIFGASIYFCIIFFIF